MAITSGSLNKNYMQEYKKQIIEDYIKSYNDFDVEGMISNLHGDVVFENISNGKTEISIKGIKAFKQQAESAKKYFSSRKQSISLWNQKQESIVVDIDYEATLAIDLSEKLKAGATLKLKGQSEFMFKDQKVIKIVDRS